MHPAHLRHVWPGQTIPPLTTCPQTQHIIAQSYASAAGSTLHSSIVECNPQQQKKSQSNTTYLLVVTLSTPQHELHLLRPAEVISKALSLTLVERSTATRTSLHQPTGP